MFGINQNFASEGGYCKMKKLAKSKYENINTDYELAGEENFNIQELEAFEIVLE